MLVGQRQNCRSGCGDTAEGELRSPIGALKPWPCPGPSRHCAMLECEGRAQITHSSRHNAAPAAPSRSCLCARARALDLQEVFWGFLNKPGQSRPARRFPPLPAPRPKMAPGAEASSGATMAATRLELNLMRLLSRCEALAAERRDPEEWRLEKVRPPRPSRPAARRPALSDRDGSAVVLNSQPWPLRVFLLNAVA